MDLTKDKSTVMTRERKIMNAVLSVCTEILTAVLVVVAIILHLVSPKLLGLKMYIAIMLIPVFFSLMRMALTYGRKWRRLFGFRTLLVLGIVTETIVVIGSAIIVHRLEEDISAVDLIFGLVALFFIQMAWRYEKYYLQARTGIHLGITIGLLIVSFVILWVAGALVYPTSKYGDLNPDKCDQNIGAVIAGLPVVLTLLWFYFTGKEKVFYDMDGDDDDKVSWWAILLALVCYEFLFSVLPMTSSRLLTGGGPKLKEWVETRRQRSLVMDESTNVTKT